MILRPKAASAIPSGERNGILAAERRVEKRGFTGWQWREGREAVIG